MPDASCKNVYLLLLDLPAVAPRCAGFWGSVVNRPINRWALVWRKSRLKLIENKKNDLIWLLIHRVVRVRYALKSWKIIKNDKCTVCNQRETIEHCFIECRRVVRVWHDFSCILSRLLDYPFVLSSSSAFYPSSKAQSSTGISLSNRPFSEMAAENLIMSKLKTNTSTRKSVLNLVTLPSFSISGEISAEKM